MKEIRTSLSEKECQDMLDRALGKQKQVKWLPDTYLQCSKGKYFICYRSGKDTYKWAVNYNENTHVIELQRVWGVTDYLVLIPMLLMQAVFLGYFIWHALWKYILVIFIVFGCLVFLPYYFFAFYLGEKKVAAYMEACLSNDILL